MFYTFTTETLTGSVHLVFHEGVGYVSPHKITILSIFTCAFNSIVNFPYYPEGIVALIAQRLFLPVA